MIKIFLLALSVLLTSCAIPVKPLSAPPNIKLWQQHLSQVQDIKHWEMSGRVAMQSADNGGQADLFWQQTDNQHYDIKLVAPFGSGSTHLHGQASGVVLSTSDGQLVTAQNADDLLQQVQGWRFPVNSLRYWLFGVPSPASPAQLISWNEQGMLYVMQQDGWRIELRQYIDVAGKTLPRKLFITRPDDDSLDVRLMVREWQLHYD